MLFPEADTTVLKAWIVKRLETPSRSDNDVDADVLADYVLALLRHEGDAAAVRRLCEAELVDFLKEESVPFVKDVFQAVMHRSYLPGAKPPPRTNIRLPPPPSTAASKEHDQTYPLGYGASQQVQDTTPLPTNDDQCQFPASSNGSRKRPHNDASLNTRGSDGGDTSNDQGKRAIKQARRKGGFQGGQAATPGAPWNAASSSYGMLPGAAMMYPTGGGLMKEHAVPSLEEILQMQQHMGLPIPPAFAGYVAPLAGKAKKPARRRRCRYLDKKGFCSRADCKFDHSQQMAQTFPFGPVQASPETILQFTQSGIYPTMPSLPTPYFPPTPDTSQLAAKTRLRKGGRRASFSADGPVVDQRKSTIVVEGIPDEFLRMEEVDRFFSQFGSIVDMSVQPEKRLAIIKFDSWTSANDAYRSPKAVFDNRFVKVYWYREENAHETAKALSKRPSAVGQDSNDSDAGSAGATPDIDMDEFLRKQEEAQKLYEEKTQKKQELDRQRQALELRQKDLQTRQLEERQKLVSKMALAAKRARKRQDDHGIGSDADDHGGSDGSDTKLATGAKAEALTQTEMIRAQLAALEEEARMLGLDPDSIVGDSATGHASDGQSPLYASWAPRGGGYGRGGSRGRGGGYQTSRGGGNASLYAAYSLDNRPRRVVVSGVDFTQSATDEALRQYLLGVGDFTAIDTTGNAATITFSDRRTAEMFCYGLPKAKTVSANGDGKQTPIASRIIPGIDEPVALSWVANSAGSAAGATLAEKDRNDLDGVPAVARSSADQKTAEDNGLFLEASSSEDELEQEDEGAPQLQRQIMDFDVAGDGDW